MYEIEGQMTQKKKYCLINFIIHTIINFNVLICFVPVAADC